jgi:small-conductance mechanosensitive channel
MDIDLIRQRTSDAFGHYLDSILSALPGLAAGLLVLLIGYGIAALLRWITYRSLQRMGLERLAQRGGLEGMLRRVGGIAQLCGKVVFYLTMLFFILAAAEVMELTLLTDALRRFFAYLPRLLAAMGMLLFGLWLAGKAKNLMDGLSTSIGLAGGRIVGRLLFGIIVLIMSISALNIAGVDTTLITSNILVLLGGMLIAFGIAYGFASRDILTNILGSFYGKDRFEPGMHVRIGADEGIIERIDSIAVTLRSHDRSIIIPASRLVTERIELMDAADSADAGRSAA